MALHGPRQDDKLTTTSDAQNAFVNNGVAILRIDPGTTGALDAGFTGSLKLDASVAAPRSGPLKMTILTLPLLHFERTSGIFQSCLAD
jgi:hypothetical protein